MAQEQSTVFQQLKTFLTRQMRMSHLYQPLMLRTLIEKGGFASLRDIASSFLMHDESQIEYYVEITKRMPGPVLTRHQLVRRDRTGYPLHRPLSAFSSCGHEAAPALRSFVPKSAVFTPTDTAMEVAAPSTSERMTASQYCMRMITPSLAPARPAGRCPTD
jgi:hypothetical protein